MVKTFCEETSTALRNAGFTVPWDMIMQLIMQLISGCGTNAKSAVRRGELGPIQRVSWNMRVAKTCGLSYRRACAAADVIFDAAVKQQRLPTTGGAGDWCDAIEAEVDSETT